jgi:hypothetical protein
MVCKMGGRSEKTVFAYFLYYIYNLEGEGVKNPKNAEMYMIYGWSHSKEIIVFCEYIDII